MSAATIVDPEFTRWMVGMPGAADGVLIDRRMRSAADTTGGAASKVQAPPVVTTSGAAIEASSRALLSAKASVVVVLCIAVLIFRALGLRNNHRWRRSRQQQKCSRTCCEMLSRASCSASSWRLSMPTSVLTGSSRRKSHNKVPTRPRRVRHHSPDRDAVFENSERLERERSVSACEQAVTGLACMLAQSLTAAQWGG